MNKFLESIWKILENMMDFFIRKLFRIKLSDKQWDTFLQFVKFGIVGLSNNIVYYGLYALFFYLVLPPVVINGKDYAYMIAHTIGFFISVANAFYWNNKYVFKSEEGEERSLLQAFIKTLISYGCTNYVLEAGLLFVWVEYLHVAEIVAPLITLVITIPFNYILNKFWAFKGK